ncbi:hypothetical protein FQR65_LT17065 [Abscondita terminalis]|nr:hypothetical protein FQR65_LT17065 [Abscondita terminalis]
MTIWLCCVFLKSLATVIAVKYILEEVHEKHLRNYCRLYSWDLDRLSQGMKRKHMRNPIIRKRMPGKTRWFSCKSTKEDKTIIIQAGGLRKTLGIVLPEVPAPAGNYQPFDGKIVHPGKIGADIDENQARQATEVTMLNVLAVLNKAVGGCIEQSSPLVQINWVENASRNKIQNAIRSWTLAGSYDSVIKSSYKVKPFDIISVVLPDPPRDTEVYPRDIPLDIIFEDEK